MVGELAGPTPILKSSKTLLTKKSSPDAPRDGPRASVWQAGTPFVLLDDARDPTARARLLTRPAGIIETRAPAEAAACAPRPGGVPRLPGAPEGAGGAPRRRFPLLRGGLRARAEAGAARQPARRRG